MNPASALKEVSLHVLVASHTSATLSATTAVARIQPVMVKDRLFCWHVHIFRVLLQDCVNCEQKL